MESDGISVFLACTSHKYGMQWRYRSDDWISADRTQKEASMRLTRSILFLFTAVAIL